MYVLFLLVSALYNLLYTLPIVSSLVGTLTGLIFLGAILSLFVIGLRLGSPRWFLPYLGFILGIVSVYFLSALLGAPVVMFFPNRYERLLFLGDILFDGMLWYGLLAVIVLLVVLARTSPSFRRFSADWTLLCFIAYGAVPFAVGLTFDEYVGEEPYVRLALLVLAVGAWRYLRGNAHGGALGRCLAP
jgi:hypothetical protein